LLSYSHMAYVRVPSRTRTCRWPSFANLESILSASETLSEVSGAARAALISPRCSRTLRSSFSL